MCCDFMPDDVQNLVHNLERIACALERIAAKDNTVRIKQQTCGRCHGKGTLKDSCGDPQQCSLCKGTGETI
jgi:DnaJ-class molecular chaperone